MSDPESRAAATEAADHRELELAHAEQLVVTDASSIPAAAEATGDATQEQAVTDARQAVAAAFETTTASHDDGLGTSYRLYVEGL